MIRVNRLNNEAFLVNADLIEFVEETPHTVISMTSGRRVLVVESAEDVKRMVMEYKRLIYGPNTLRENHHRTEVLED